MPWIDTHNHLDAAEFDADRPQVVQRSKAAGVHMLVLPAVAVSNFETVRSLAHEHGLSYALGIHPLFVDAAADEDLDRLQDALQRWHDDPRLVAVGEIGLDHLVPAEGPRHEHFFSTQLKLARDAGLPAIMHVRRTADGLLKHLRRIEIPGGIAHAFNGSEQQADAFVQMGFRLGFGGAMTFDRALQIRRLAAHVPDHAPVLETDAPDIPPHWLYRTAEERENAPQARNEPAQLPRIAQTLAELRGWTLEHTAGQTARNACAALPKLQALLA